MLQGWGGVIVHNPPDCADFVSNKSEGYRLSSKVIAVMEISSVIYTLDLLACGSAG